MTNPFCATCNDMRFVIIEREDETGRYGMLRLAAPCPTCRPKQPTVETQTAIRHEEQLAGLAHPHSRIRTAEGRPVEWTYPGRDGKMAAAGGDL